MRRFRFAEKREGSPYRSKSLEVEGIPNFTTVPATNAGSFAAVGRGWLSFVL